MNDPQFDRYAESYSDLHRESTRISGEEPIYFAQGKVDFMVKILAGTGSDPHSVLDFGCGIGGTLPSLSRAFPRAQLLGTDVSEASLKVASSLDTGADLRLAQDNRIPAADSSVQVAIAACVFHHIPVPERAAWLSELKRVLKPNGYLFIFEHNPWNPVTLKIVRDCPFDHDAVLLRPDETLALLGNAGFTQVKRKFTMFFPNALRSLRRFESSLEWCPLGAQYAAYGCA